MHMLVQHFSPKMTYITTSRSLAHLTQTFRQTVVCEIIQK